MSALIPDITCEHIRIYLGKDKIEGIQVAKGLLKIFEATICSKQFNQAIEKATADSVEELADRFRPKSKAEQKARLAEERGKA